MGGLDDTAFTDVYREGPPPPGGYKEPSSVGGREDPRPPVISGVDDERTTSAGWGRRHIVNYGGDARRSGEHGHDNGRPAATPQAPGAAAPSGGRTQGSWKPQRSYVIGVHSYLEAFGGAGVSWIGGRGDGLSRQSSHWKPPSTQGGCTTAKQMSTGGPPLLR